MLGAEVDGDGLSWEWLLSAMGGERHISAGSQLYNIARGSQ